MILTSEQLRNEWNKNINYYAFKLEKPNSVQGISMTNMFKFKDGDNILEVGCGSGVTSCYLLQNLNVKCNYLAFDLADEMIQVAQKRKEAITYDKDLIHHEFKNANAENLDFVKDESIDIYFAPLCLHLVTEPVNMLKEAYRVLKKGASCGFSVLGRPENCNMLTVLPEKLKEVGFEAPSRRNLFYLGERDTLINLVKKEGFEVEFCWTTTGALPIYTVDEFYELMSSSGRFNDNLKELDEASNKKLRELIEEDFKNRKEKHIPLQAEFLILIAKKL